MKARRPRCWRAAIRLQQLSVQATRSCPECWPSFLRRSLRIPDDVSIVTTDRIDLAELFSPPLATITRDPEEMGRMAANQLLQQLSGASPVRIMLPTKFEPQQAAPRRLRVDSWVNTREESRAESSVGSEACARTRRCHGALRRLGLFDRELVADEQGLVLIVVGLDQLPGRAVAVGSVRAHLLHRSGRSARR